MERWAMYCKIHSMKNEGFSQRQVSKIAGISRKTVRKYWDMEPDEYNELALEPAKKSSLEQHRDQIVSWLKQYPGLTAAQVFDWLLERYKITLTEGSIRRFVNKLREEHDIKSTAYERDYQAVEELPMGYQMQIDIGIENVENAITRKHQKLYCIGFVLANSRYKYGIWFDRPPKAVDMVNSIYNCFEWMGGKPKELVFDQDRLIAVDENYGDITFTKEFEAFRQEEKLKVYLCRGADPESKGKIEAVVKFFKRNFAKYRQFVDLRLWTEEFDAWLDRTGNGKVHSVTKKVPAEVFEIERQYLTPIPKTNCSHTEIITRAVRKDNTILYEGNRYTVPLGTFKVHKEVNLDIVDGDLLIYDIFWDVLIAQHKICEEKGRLIRNNHHLRNNESKINDLQIQIKQRFEDIEKASIFLDNIRKAKPRYVRDQYRIIEKVLDEFNQAIVMEALDFCIKNELYSAVDFKDAVNHFNDKVEEIPPPKEPPKIVKPIIDIKTQKRNIKEYTERLLGGKDGWIN